MKNIEIKPVFDDAAFNKAIFAAVRNALKLNNWLGFAGWPYMGTPEQKAQRQQHVSQTIEQLMVEIERESFVPELEPIWSAATGDHPAWAKHYPSDFALPHEIVEFVDNHVDAKFSTGELVGWRLRRPAPNPSHPMIAPAQ